MQTLSAKDAKYGFGRLIDLARAEPIAVVEAVYSSDEAKRRLEILARQVFVRFKALLMEPSVFAYAEQHDNIEAIYKKLTERRDTAERQRRFRTSARSSSRS